MATMDELFLNDLEEMENDFMDQEDNQAENTELKDEFGLPKKGDLSSLMADVNRTKYNDMKHLLKDPTYNSFIETIRKESEDPNSENSHITQIQEYVNQSNQYISDISDEINILKKQIIDIYSKRFPNLHTDLPNTLDYIRAVERIGNHEDIMEMTFSDFLPKTLEMEVKVSGAASLGEPLSEQELKSVLELCHDALKLDDDRGVLLSYIEQKMNSIAPNVCTLIGSHVAALMLGQVGGLKELSSMPSSNITNLGQSKVNALSTIGNKVRQGYLYQTDLIQNIPPDYRQKASKILANKLILAARADLSGLTDNHLGIQYRDYVNQQVERWQAPSEGSTIKPMKAPDNKPKSRRGGRRIRRIKELYKASAMERLRSRVQMDNPSGSYGDDAIFEEDMGMLNQVGTGILKVQANKKSFANSANKRLARLHMSGATTSSGISTSLIVNASDGFELVTKTQDKKTDDKYFSASSGFTSVRPN